MTDESTDLLGRVSYLVKRFELGLRIRMDDQLRALGITAQQFTVMSTLRRVPDLSAAELARYSKVTPQAMSQLLTGLERRGLLKRAANPQSRRIALVRLSRKGERVQQVCDEVVRRIDAELLDALPAGAPSELLRSLAVCCRMLGTLEQPRSPAATSTRSANDAG